MTTHILVLLVTGGLLLPALAAEGRPERPSASKDDHWSTGVDRPHAGPGAQQSYVLAGPRGYFNNGGPLEDVNTVGLHLSACAKEVLPYTALRADGFLGFRDVAEGLVEVDATLLRGFSVGAGAAYTERMGWSPRLGFYLEDLEDPALRVGVYMLEVNGFGLEMGVPFAESWSFAGDFSRERDGQDDYTRVVAGIDFRF